MDLFIHLFILIPFAGFLVSLIIPRKKEDLLSTISFGTVGVHAALAAGFIVYWVFNGHPTLDIKDIALFHSADYEFFIDFSFDSITATYLFVGTVLTFLVTVYSRYYLHREAG